MQYVLGRYCFLADATIGEGAILRNPTIKVMSDHDHAEGFVGRVHGVGSRRSGRGWEDIGLTAHSADVWGVAAAGAFAVKGVDSSGLESGDGIFDEAALVQRVGVDGNLHVHVIRDREAAIDRTRRRTPVLMKLETARASLDLLNETLR